MRATLLLALLVGLVACGAPPPRPTSAADPCAFAATLRSRVNGLLAQGRLDRVRRVLARANQLCPATAPESWGDEVTTLAELGRFDEARALAGQIDAAPSAPAAARKAAAAARSTMARLDRTFPDTGRPNGTALAAAGLVEKRRWNTASAQRLFDRAAVELARETGEEPALELLDGLPAPIRAVAWSPAGDRLAVAAAQDLFLLEAGTLRVVARLSGNGGEVSSVAYSPDGRELVFGAEDGTVRRWDTVALRELPAFAAHRRPVSAVAWSPDGARLCSGSSDGAVRLWGATGGEPGQTLTGFRGAVRSLALSPDGREVAAGTSEGAVHLWSALSGAKVAVLEQKPGGEVESLAYSPDGARLVAASTDRAVRVWDLAARTVTLTLAALARTVVFSPDGARLATASGGFVQTWDAGTGAPIWSLGDTFGGVTAVSYSRDGKRLAAVTALGSVHLWNPVTGAAERGLAPRAEKPGPVLYAPGGGSFASRGFGKGAVRLWDLAAGTLQTLTRSDETVTAASYSVDGARLAILSASGTFDIREVATGRRIQMTDEPVTLWSTLAYSPDGAYLAMTGWDRTIRLLDPSSGKPGRALRRVPATIHRLLFSPDGQQLAAATRDEEVPCWEVATGALTRKLVGHEGSVRDISYSSDGTELASASDDGTIRVWDPRTGKALHVFPGTGAAVLAVVYSPDGARLASIAEDGTVRLWDTRTRAPRMVLGWPPASGASPAFSKNGDVLAVASRDDAITFFRVSDGAVLATVRTLYGEDAGLVFTGSHVDFTGARACAARAGAVCRSGARVFPIDVCEERAYVRGLLAKVHAGDTAYLEPEGESPLMRCEE